MEEKRLIAARDLHSCTLYAQYLSFYREARSFWPFTYSNHLVHSITYYILFQAVPSCHVDIFKHTSPLYCTKLPSNSKVARFFPLFAFLGFVRGSNSTTDVIVLVWILWKASQKMKRSGAIITFHSILSTGSRYNGSWVTFSNGNIPTSLGNNKLLYGIHSLTDSFLGKSRFHNIPEQQLFMKWQNQILLMKRKNTQKQLQTTLGWLRSFSQHQELWLKWVFQGCQWVSQIVCRP